MLTVLRCSACSSFGSYWLREQLERCCQRTGVKVIRVHYIRHSHASLLINMGTDALLVQQRFGHEKVSTTLGTYAHLYPDRANNVADCLEALASLEEKNRDTGLIPPGVLLFCYFGRKTAPPSSESS